MMLAVVVSVLLALLPSGAHAEKRVALVIGNSAYKHAGELTNPRNDASDMSAALKKRGFQVIDGFDLDKASFDRKIRDFAMALSGAEVGLLFYAGHGLQVAGQNYLVPVDAELTTASALEFEMVRLDVLHRIMEREAQTNILFLDACRNNPLARNLARAMGTRSGEIGRGLATVESGSGTLISFSTQPGNVALDGTGRNSPFAAALVKYISTSSDDLSAVLISVRNDVMKETQRKQVPWEHSALTGRFYFNITINVSPQPVGPTPALRLSEAAEAWNATKETTNIAALELFMGRYKETYFADLARLRIEELKKQRVAVTPSQPLIPANVFFKGQTASQLIVRQGALVGATVHDAADADLGTIEALIVEQTETVGLLFNHRGKMVGIRSKSPLVTIDAPRRSVRLNAQNAQQVLAALEPYQRSFEPPAPTPGKCVGVEIAVGANERRCLKPGAGKTDWFKDCADCPEMVVAPAGRFTMGSPADEPEREPFNKGSEDQLAVTIVKPFAVGRFAVTRGQFAAFVTATGPKTDGGCYARMGTEWKQQADRNWRSPGFTQNDHHPVVCVNWDDAKAYAAWLSSTTGKTYRLLSEAEREYAARAGTTTGFWWGSTISTSQSNYDGNYTYDGGLQGEWRKATVPVDSFAANPWGLYNVHGNAWDWTEDCWSGSNAGNPGNGEARSSGDCSRRVFRGGSWSSHPQFLRSANRGKYLPAIRDGNLGFRVARTLLAP